MLFQHRVLNMEFSTEGEISQCNCGFTAFSPLRKAFIHICYSDFIQNWSQGQLKKMTSNLHFEMCLPLSFSLAHSNVSLPIHYNPCIVSQLVQVQACVSASVTVGSFIADLRICINPNCCVFVHIFALSIILSMLTCLFLSCSSRWSSFQKVWYPGTLSGRYQPFGDGHCGLPDAEAELVSQWRLWLCQAQKIQHLTKLQLHGAASGLWEDIGSE